MGEKWTKINSGDDPAEIFSDDDNKKILSIIPAGNELYHIIIEDKIDNKDIEEVMFMTSSQVINLLRFNPWE